MSRRTKLTITTLFLVLLGIPVVYLAFTWSPVEPLRFRLLSLHPLPADTSRELLEIEVTNTSAVPIHLFMAVLQRDSATGGVEEVLALSASKGHSASPSAATTGGSSSIRIPAHSTVKCEAEIDHVANVQGSARMNHTWISHPKYLTYKMVIGLYPYVPESLYHYIPRPQFSESDALLEQSPPHGDR
jgi:hypothetical protein